MLRTATLMPNLPWLVDRKPGRLRVMTALLWVLIRGANKILVSMPWKLNILNRVVSHKFFTSPGRWASLSGEHLFGYSGTIVTSSGLAKDSLKQLLNRPENVPCFFDPEVKARGEIFVHASNAPYNYFHFVYDFILPLFTHRLKDITTQVYLPFQPAAWQIEWLQLIGQGDVYSAKFNGHLSADKISRFETFLDSRNRIRRPLELTEFRRYLIDSIPQSNSYFGSPKHIFLKRSKGPMGRNLSNQKQLMGHLESRGFKSLRLDGLSVAEQLTLFANAETIIGPHDAGLSNLLVSAASTKVVEILPVQAPGLYDMYKNLSSIANLDYSNVVSLKAIDYTIGNDFFVELSKVDGVLES